jgi:hypothetical protein
MPPPRPPPPNHHDRRVGSSLGQKNVEPNVFFQQILIQLFPKMFVQPFMKYAGSTFWLKNVARFL